MEVEMEEYEVVKRIDVLLVSLPLTNLGVILFC
jgi:hypothetical protein